VQAGRSNVRGAGRVTPPPPPPPSPAQRRWRRGVEIRYEIKGAHHQPGPGPTTRRASSAVQDLPLVAKSVRDCPVPLLTGSSHTLANLGPARRTAQSPPVPCPSCFLAVSLQSRSPLALATGALLITAPQLLSVATLHLSHLPAQPLTGPHRPHMASRRPLLPTKTLHSAGAALIATETAYQRAIQLVKCVRERRNQVAEPLGNDRGWLRKKRRRHGWAASVSYGLWRELVNSNVARNLPRTPWLAMWE